MDTRQCCISHCKITVAYTVCYLNSWYPNMLVFYSNSSTSSLFRNCLKLYIFPHSLLEIFPLTITKFYIITQGTCSSPRSLWEMPDLVYFILDRNFTQKNYATESYFYSIRYQYSTCPKKHCHLKPLNWGLCYE